MASVYLKYNAGVTVFIEEDVRYGFIVGFDLSGF